MIEIRTLGRTSVAVNGELLTGEAAWPKSLALIVFMAREPGPDRREEILGVLWPDVEEKRARRALNQLVYTLRKASPELDLESVSGAIDFGREVWLDVEEFESRLEAEDLKGAVELYGGPFLVDLRVDAPEFDHWADRQRADLARKFRRAALQLATQAKEAGDCESAVELCRRVVDADPLDDEAQHLLIECFHLRGDRVSALRQFDVYRGSLADELDVEPLDHTRDLVARIRGELGPEAAPAQSEPERVATATEQAPPSAERPESRERAPEGLAPGPRTRRWLLSMVLIAVAVVALAIVLWPKGGPEITAGAAVSARAESWRIAVLPFNGHGLGEEDEGRAEGTAQLLGLKLEAEGLAIVPYREVMRIWSARTRDGATELGVEDLGSLADDLDANAVVFGDLHGGGSDFWIVAELHAPAAGGRLARLDVRGSRDTYFSLLDQIATQLGLALPSRAEGEPPR